MQAGRHLVAARVSDDSTLQRRSEETCQPAPSALTKIGAVAAQLGAVILG